MHHEYVSSVGLAGKQWDAIGQRKVHVRAISARFNLAFNVSNISAASVYVTR